jgi:hypothetical protein
VFPGWLLVSPSPLSRGEREGTLADRICKFARLVGCLLPLLLAGWSNPALAESAEPAVGYESAANTKSWEFSSVTYVWLAGAEGDVDTIGPVEPVGLNLSFGDVLGSLKFAFMGAAEARHDRLVLLGDLTFIHLEANKGIDVRDEDFLDAELDSRTIEVTALGGYQVANKGPVLVDLLGGVRANFLKNSLQLSGPNQATEGSVSQTWFDPLIAARLHVPLGGKWSASVYGDVGGFGIASDFTWQGIATVDYDFNAKWRLQAGWRHFKVDYDKGDFLYDVAQSGLLLAVRYQF